MNKKVSKVFQDAAYIAAEMNDLIVDNKFNLFSSLVAVDMLRMKIVIEGDMDEDDCKGATDTAKFLMQNISDFCPCSECEERRSKTTIQ